MKALSLLALTLFTTGALAENIQLPAEILASPSVAAEMTVAAVDTEIQWNKFSDQVDAEKNLYVRILPPEGTIQAYQFDYFSAEHYNCGFMVEWDKYDNSVKVSRRYECRIDGDEE